MALPIFQRTIVNDNGDVLSGAEITVVDEATGLNATLFSDRAGATGKANPFFTESDGLARFYVAQGEYRITSVGVSGTVTWRYVSILDETSLVNTFPKTSVFGVGGVAVPPESGGDFDQVSKTGFYKVEGSATNVAHIPGTLIHTEREANGASQINFGRDSSIASMRSKNSSGVWLPWRSITSKPPTIVIITESGTYNTPSDAIAIRMTLIGAGGGSGGSDGQGVGTAAVSSAGANGARVKKLIDDPEGSYTVVIGAGGSGGTGTGGGNGTDGGDSTVTSVSVNLIARGGGNGNGMIGVAGHDVAIGGEGGTGTGGDTNEQGNDTSNSVVLNGEIVSYGNALGGRRGRGTAGTSGFDGVNPGEGGSGSGSVDSDSNSPGGDGADGMLIVEELY